MGVKAEPRFTPFAWPEAAPTAIQIAISWLRAAPDVVGEVPVLVNQVSCAETAAARE